MCILSIVQGLELLRGRYPEKTSQDTKVGKEEGGYLEKSRAVRERGWVQEGWVQSVTGSAALHTECCYFLSTECAQWR